MGGQDLIATAATGAWLAPAIAAPLLWGASNVIDDHLVNQGLRSTFALVLITGAFASLPALFFAATGRWVWPGLPVAGTAILAGVLGLLVYAPYFEALKVGSPASIILMWNLSPALVAVLAHLTIGETLRAPQYLGMLLLVASSSFAAVRLGRTQRVRGAFGWMTLASVLLALSSVMEKGVFQRVPFEVGFAWISLGSLLTTLVLAFALPDARRQLAKALRTQQAAILLLNEGLDLGASTSLEYATSVGPVSLVHAVGGIQPLFVLLFATLSIRHTENLKRDWLSTAVAVGLAFVGLGLVQSGA